MAKNPIWLKLKLVGAFKTPCDKKWGENKITSLEQTIQKPKMYLEVFLVGGFTEIYELTPNLPGYCGLSSLNVPNFIKNTKVFYGLPWKYNNIINNNNSKKL